jgi:hypothetical protein
MVYQDHLTKFIVLRPLTSKPAAVVAYQLLDIFLLLGAPQILQSDNGQQELQAQKMVKRSRRVMVEGSIGDNVTVPIPSFDRGRTDPRNLIGVITDKDENGLYRIAVKSGMLEGKFTRNQFDICAYALYSINDMNMEKNSPPSQSSSWRLHLWRSRICQMQLQWVKTMPNKKKKMLVFQGTNQMQFQVS